MKSTQYPGLVSGVRDIDLRSGSLRSSAGSALHFVALGNLFLSLGLSSLIYKMV